MKFGINFFPTVTPAEKSGAQYYDECLDLAEGADALGYSHVRTVEHYFYAYGGYSPDPVTFLSAVAQRTSRCRLITGAVIPSFNHPIKLAGKLAMLDNLSHGRLDVGFARAFLPGEFEAFQVSMGESRPRFDEGIQAIRRLWTEEAVVWNGTFHQFGPVTLLPRPFQQPCPPIWIAATFNPESFERAGSDGFNLMMVPYVSSHENVAALVERYRAAWRAAGHPPGAEQVSMSFHLYLAEDGDQARTEGQLYFDDYTRKMIQAIERWDTTKSDQYPGYENLVGQMKKNTFEKYLAETKLFVGTPGEVAAQVEHIQSIYGDVQPSLQINFGNLPYDRARRSLELFAERVMPLFQDDPEATRARPASVSHQG